MNVTCHTSTVLRTAPLAFPRRLPSRERSSWRQPHGAASHYGAAASTAAPSSVGATASGPAVGVQSTARTAPPAVTLAPAIWPNSFKSLGRPRSPPSVGRLLTPPPGVQKKGRRKSSLLP